MTDYPLDEAEFESLHADLQDAGRLEAVPLDVVAAVKAAIVWRTMDAELAELTYDSELDELATAGARSGGESRMLTFEGSGLMVEVESFPSGSGRRLMGQFVPPGPGRVDIRHGGGTTTVEADEVGRFSADAIAPGPVSLRCQAADGSGPIVTDWVVV